MGYASRALVEWVRKIAARRGDVTKAERLPSVPLRD
jgi:hypothetical protein